MYDANLKRRLKELVGPAKAVNKDDTSTTPTPSATALDKVKGQTPNTTTETTTNPLYNYGYTDTYKKLADDYGNKASQDFSYNVYGSNLYNQYKDQYTKQAQISAEDAAGRAAALTGGYGNSYVVSAAANAYNARMDDLNGVALQLYQLALDKFDKDRTYNTNMANYYQGLDAEALASAQALYSAKNAPKEPVSLEGLERIEEELKQAKTMEQVNNILDKWASAMTPDQEALLYDLYWRDESGYKNADGTYNYYNMLKNSNAWKAGADGGTNYFGKIDGDAELISPFGEILTGDQLLDKLRKEKISDKEAIDLIVALQKLYGINE